MKAIVAFSWAVPAFGSAVGYIIGAYPQQKGDADGGQFTLTLLKGSDGGWLIVADMDRPYRRTP